MYITLTALSESWQTGERATLTLQLLADHFKGSQYKDYIDLERQLPLTRSYLINLAYSIVINL